MGARCMIFAPDVRMRTITLPLPLLGFIISTRAVLGVGLGLLLASQLPSRQRRTAGFALVGFGAATTIPIAFWVSRRLHARRSEHATLVAPTTHH